MEYVGSVVKKMKSVPMTWLIGAAAVIAVVLYFFLGRRGEGFQGEAPPSANVFTMYYADWCPHCKDVKPLFSSYAGSGVRTVNEKPVFIKMVEEKQIDKSKDPAVDGFPTFLLKKEDGTTVPYEGERTEAGWEGFLKANVA
jgi:thiol-disulfide isomerase/thioredoxin